MENQKKPIATLVGHIEAYAKTGIKLFKYKAIDKTAGLVSDLVSWFAVIFALIMVFVNLNIGIALLLGYLLGKLYLGFLVIAGFYACVGLLFYIFRAQWIKKPVNDFFVKQLLADKQAKDGPPPA